MALRFSMTLSILGLGLTGVCAQTARDAELSEAQLSRVTPLVRVVQAVGPSVVNIYQEVVQEVSLRPPYDRLFGPQLSRRTSLGSGVIIDRDGYILTNAHVIDSDVPEGIQVRLPDGSSHAAQLINTDPANDVALLKINADRELPVAALGTSSDALVGETVIAIGNPLGNENSVTSGIISSVFRDVRIHGRAAEGRFRDYIQVDAPINPGNSGGPLLNIHGEVIGINWAIATEAEGIGFAIPIDRVRESLIDTLLNPLVGRGVDAGVSIAGDAWGRDVQLASVQADSPASRAGLRAGDRIVSVDGQPVNWVFDFNKALYRATPERDLDIVVRRDGRRIEAQLPLRIAESPVSFVQRILGLRVVDHPRYFGVHVEGVEPNSPAARLPIRRGDLIDGLDGIEIDNVESLYQAVREGLLGNTVTVHLFRNGQPLRGRMTVR